MFIGLGKFPSSYGPGRLPLHLNKHFTQFLLWSLATRKAWSHVLPGFHVMGRYRTDCAFGRLPLVTYCRRLHTSHCPRSWDSVTGRKEKPCPHRTPTALQPWLVLRLCVPAQIKCLWGNLLFKDGPTLSPSQCALNVVWLWHSSSAWGWVGWRAHPSLSGTFPVSVLQVLCFGNPSVLDKTPWDLVIWG